MILQIDTASIDKLTVILNGEKLVSSKDQRTNEQLLPLIEKLLKIKKTSINKLEKIFFNPGPGSFTGLKIGAAVVNALAWSLQIPVNGQKKLIKPDYGKFLVSKSLKRKGGD